MSTPSIVTNFIPQLQTPPNSPLFAGQEDVSKWIDSLSTNAAPYRRASVSQVPYDRSERRSSSWSLTPLVQNDTSFNELCKEMGVEALFPSDTVKSSPLLDIMEGSIKGESTDDFYYTAMKNLPTTSDELMGFFKCN